MPESVEISEVEINNAIEAVRVFLKGEPGWHEMTVITQVMNRNRHLSYTAVIRAINILKQQGRVYTTGLIGLCYRGD